MWPRPTLSARMTYSGELPQEVLAQDYSEVLEALQRGRLALGPGKPMTVNLAPGLVLAEPMSVKPELDQPARDLQSPPQGLIPPPTSQPHQSPRCPALCGDPTESKESGVLGPTQVLERPTPTNGWTSTWEVYSVAAR